MPDAERLLRECVRDYKPPLTESRIRNLLRYARSPGHSLLLYSGKDLVAMAAFRRYRTRDFSYYGYPRARGLAGFAYLKTLLVAPRWRRKGVALLLRTSAVALLRKRGFKGVASTCWAKNVSMVRLNERMGFTMLGRFPASWRGKGEESLLWEKRFRAHP